MPRVKFLVDTVHPDYGAVQKGEILRVPAAYLRDYLAAGVAEEADDDAKVSRPEPKDASQRDVDTMPPGTTRNEHRA